MKITFAKPMTKEEVDSFRDSMKRSQGIKKTNSLEWCYENEERILSDHEKFPDDFKREKYNRYYSNLKKNIEQWNNTLDERNNEILKIYELADSISNGIKHNCSCGNGGQLVRKTSETYDFIGCNKFYQQECGKETYNFKPLREEKIFSDEIVSYDDWKPYHEITYTYIKRMAKYNDYPKFVRVSDIYRTLKLNNVKFYCEISEDNFNVGVQASRQSQHEEIVLLKRLEKIPNIKVIYQQHFWYKTESDEKNKIAIPDYIIFNDKKVVILDAKKSVKNCNLDQINKYLEIVSKVASKVKDIKAYHILFDRSDATADQLQKNQVVTINDINNEFN